MKQAKEYDIYTQSGEFVTTELASAGHPWASGKFWITVGVTFLIFMTLLIISGVIAKEVFGFKTAFLKLLLSAALAGFTTYKIFMSVLKAGDGKVIHRAGPGESEVVTFYDQTLLPDKWGGGFSLMAYGPDLAFKYPGTRPEGTLDLSTKYIIRGVEKKEDHEASFSVSCGTGSKAEDEVLIDALCPLRLTIRYAYVTFVAIRGFDDVESYIIDTVRSLINNALDKTSAKYKKAQLLADKFDDFSEEARELFVTEFEELQKTDPIFRGLAFMNKNGVVFSNPRDNDTVAEARNEKARRLLLAESTTEAARKILTAAKRRGQDITWDEAALQAQVDAGTATRSENNNNDKKTITLSPETAELLGAFLVKGGSK